MDFIKPCRLLGRVLCLFIVHISVVLNVYSQDKQTSVYLKNELVKVEFDPASFSVSFLDSAGEKYEASAASPSEPFSNFSSSEKDASWTYPGKKLSVHIELRENNLNVEIAASDTSEIKWPRTGNRVKAFTIPFAQGKFIPATDPLWIEQLTNEGPFSGSQDLSMQFFATNFDRHALLYVIGNMYNNAMFFGQKEGALSLEFRHEFTATAKNKSCTYRIYMIKNDPVSIAKTYKKYVEEKENVRTLEEKAADNPNIRKLYGAPFIYIWNNEAIAVSDVIQWKQLKMRMISEASEKQINPTKHILALFAEQDAEYGKEFLSQFDDFKKSAYVIKYHQLLLTKAISESLKKKDFYNADAWKAVNLNEDTKKLIKKGIENLNETELYRLNESLLSSAYAGLLKPYADWGGAPVSMLNEMYAAGIKKAWLGFDDWVPGELHPDFVNQAKKYGYLIAPYDSYHSIHPPGKEQWSTAKFDDTTLYSTATVLRKDGKPQKGFLGAGRQLNPVMAMPAVRERVASIMKNSDSLYNSWFIDCDGTGEIFDDYTPGRMTDQNEDLQARLKRMAWIRDNYKLVIGTEVGNDFAANTIAFGHGMTTSVIAWNDPDMRKNKTSPYFMGGYFSNTGGIPLRYSLQVPLKSKYEYVYYDNRFNVPLFQLVYNNAVITSHHWESGSLKFTGEIKNNKLKEILYNVPPLYHLDGESWEKFKSIIIPHLKVFTKTHETAVMQEMTAFEWLTKNKEVQRTQFGTELEIIANFGQDSFAWKNIQIPSGSVWIHYLKSDKQEIYRP